MLFSGTQCTLVGKIWGGNSYVCVTFPVEFDLKQAKKKPQGAYFVHILSVDFIEPGELQWEKESKKKKEIRKMEINASNREEEMSENFRHCKQKAIQYTFLVIVQNRSIF